MIASSRATRVSWPIDVCHAQFKDIKPGPPVAGASQPAGLLATDDNYLKASVRGHRINTELVAPQGTRALAIQRAADIGPLAKITRLQGTLSTLRHRGRDRDDLCEEMDYYTTKVGKLHTKQAKHHETPKETEKRLRNEKKLAQLQADYSSMNSDMITQMNHWCTIKLDLLSHIQTDWIHCMTLPSSFPLMIGYH